MSKHLVQQVEGCVGIESGCPLSFFALHGRTSVSDMTRGTAVEAIACCMLREIFLSLIDTNAALQR